MSGFAATPPDQDVAARRQLRAVADVVIGAAVLCGVGL